MRLFKLRSIHLLALACLFAAATLPAQIIQTAAGGGPNNLAAVNANLEYPTASAMDSAGNLYICANSANRIYKVDTTGKLTVFAGDETAGFSGDGGPATSASLAYPYGVAVDGSGNLYIADTGTQRIRKVNASTGDISTVAGDGNYSFSGDGGPATSASLADPQGVAVDSSGNLYIADTNNQRIREVMAALATPTFTFSLASLPAQSYGNPPFSVASYATSNSTGAITFALGAGSVGCTVTSSGEVTITGAATGGSYCILDASQAASASFAAAGPISQQFNIALEITTVSINNIPASATLGGSFNPAYAYIGDGTTSATSSTAGVCTVSGSTVNFVGVGTCTLTAHATAGLNFAAVDGTAQSFQVSYGFSGLLSPYAPPPVTFNVMRTMPLVWQYTDVHGTVVNSANANPQVQISGPFVCGGTDSATDITVSSSGSSGYQYDSTTNTWQFNWQVKGNAPGCYNIYIVSGQTSQTNGSYPIEVTSN